MRIRNLNIIVMLIAGIIVSIIGIVSDYTLKEIVYTMLIVLFIFYVLGSIMQLLVNKIYMKAEEAQLDEERKKLDEAVNTAQLNKESENGDN